MSVDLRVLNVEDSQDDAILLERYLRRAGYAVTMERVETAEGMMNALARPGWDVVVADYVLPRFSAPAALALVRERLPGLPFILISGAVGEATVAMAALRAGVRDYMLKTDVARLVHEIPLIAGVVREEQCAAIHLMLGKQYLEPAPEPNLARATYHGEEALMRLRADDPLYGSAVLHLAHCYEGMGQHAEATELLERYQGLGEGSRPAHWPGLPADRGLMHLERGRYFLLTEDLPQAVREAIMALHVAGSDSLRCFDCYMLLLQCAQKQGNAEEALNFGLSARMMAVEARRHDLGYIATEAVTELVRDMGAGAEDVLARLAREYRKWNIDVWQFWPGR